jgi:hypothetical protein
MYTDEMVLATYSDTTEFGKSFRLMSSVVDLLNKSNAKGIKDAVRAQMMIELYQKICSDANANYSHNSRVQPKDMFRTAPPRQSSGNDNGF